MSLLHSLSDQGDFLCATAVAAVVAGWAWLYLCRLTATAFIFAYLLTVACGLLLKLVSRSHALPVSLAPLFSFSDGAPSGHAALATIVYGTAALFFRRSGHDWRAFVGQVVCVAVIITVAVTRVTLQAHTIPDALSGVALGAVMLLIPASVLHRREVDGAPVVGRLIAGMLAVGLFMMFSGMRMPSTNFL